MFKNKKIVSSFTLTDEDSSTKAFSLTKILLDTLEIGIDIVSPYDFKISVSYRKTHIKLEVALEIDNEDMYTEIIYVPLTHVPLTHVP